MSYILDALRKSDQQRRLGAVPTLPPLPPTLAEPQRPLVLRYGLPGLIPIVVVGMTLVWWKPWPAESAAPPLALPPLAVKAAAPAQREALPLPAPVAALRPAAAVEPEMQRPPAPPRTPLPAPRAKRPAPDRVVMPTASGVTDAADQDQAALPAPLAITELPHSIRQELPALPVAVHAYSSHPRDRLVSINGRMLREGDRLSPELRLEQVTPDGMIFSYRGYRFRRAAQ